MRIDRVRAVTQSVNRCVFPWRISSHKDRHFTTRGILWQRHQGRSTQIQLREYQEECIQSVLAALGQGHQRLGISLATGSGKTIIFTQLIDRIPSKDRATQTLILAHRRELVEQAAKHCLDAYPSKTVEIEMGNVHSSGSADITVASVMSLVSSDRLSKFRPDRFKLVLVDEAHHIVASSYMKVLDYFGLAKPDKSIQDHSPALVGVSATLSRFDGLKLGSALDQIVYHKDYLDMIGEKWLSQVIFTTVKSKANLSKVKSNQNGDFQTASLSKAVNTPENNEVTVRAWLARALKRKSTIGFCVDLQHVYDLAETFQNHGIVAHWVTGETNRECRGRLLDEFKAGKFPVLLNCGVFTEGTDIPNIDCVLLARPTKSTNLLVQMIGRGMRLHLGKQNCHIIDMVSSLDTGIVTTPTLFGLDPDELVEDISPDKLKEMARKREEEARMEKSENADPSAHVDRTPVYSNRSITFTDYDSVFDLIDDTSGDRHIRGISRLAWVQVDPARYILSMTGTERLILEHDLTSIPQYAVHHQPALPAHIYRDAMEGKWRGFSRRKTVAQAETFVDAVHAADKFAMEKCAHHIIEVNAQWRCGPATEGQLSFINKLRPKDDQLLPDEITKGRAAEMIAKIKHGAQGRFSKIKREKARVERVEEKTEKVKEMKERETVKVGPLSI